ncbi:hypothetical protein [Paenibacillus tepidiphilus]|uniref:hypothetical protein n=1 Tax=Paenibacillus tepidiphilus TaxID=2608683 RepID=UPI00123A18A9|nr:hypothetical protein [Paenibacillus tepidiphilus]
MAGQTRRTKRVLWSFAGVIAAAALLYGLAYVNDMPGGLLDRRMSRALGQEVTLRIPLARTPEEALQKFRNFTTMQIVHEEPVKGGKLLFIKRFYESEGDDLQVEYVRRTWLGWKWAWGGGYSIGKSPSQEKIVMQYFSMPKASKYAAPFPLVTGELLDDSIQKVTVRVKGQGSYTAEMADTGPEHGIWFVQLPAGEFTPFEIEAYDQAGSLIARQTVEDPHGYGSIERK